MCSRKIRKPAAEVRYSYVDEDRNKAVGVAKICAKCADKLEKPKMDENYYDAF